MSDPTTTLAAWRTVTEGGTEGTWAYTDTGAVYSPEVEADVAQVYWVEDATFIATARDAMPRLLAFAEAALAMHQMDWSCGNPRHTNQEVSCPDCGVFCRSCGENWPCPTATLAEHLGGEGL